jgi:CheY-like chemotaxis protein
MDGWQFRRAQRQDPALASVPVVVVSAAGDLKERAAGLGAAACLQKPLAVDEVVTAVQRHAS